MAKKDKPEKDEINTLEKAQEAIRSKFGDGAIIIGGGAIKNIKSISTGSLSLDIATGVGGFPRGRISEMFGAEASGKTTLALETIASAQRAGGVAAMIDAEHALDFGYANALGVNMDKLMVSQPDSGEEALEIVEILCKSGGVDVAVVDSVASLVPKSELDGEVGQQHMAAQARLMSTYLRRIKGVVNHSKMALIFINQLREKVGMVFGNPEQTPGGRALKFYASLRIDLRRVTGLKGKDENDEAEAIGSRVRATCVKNKVAPPFRKAEFDIVYGKGINKNGDVLDMGEKCGFIKKTGSWYAYNDQKIGNGRPGAIEWLDEHKEVASQLTEMIIDLKMPDRRKEIPDGDDPSPAA